MSQRNSEYERKPYDLYETPEWVTEALCADASHSAAWGTVWEPACGSGKMVRTLEKFGYNVIGTDILGAKPSDFLQFNNVPPHCLAIITNPPYGPRGATARMFIERALDLTQPVNGFVAMLLRVDFDSAKTRACIFGGHPAFSRKIVLRKRIKWFDSGSKNGASENHAWFCWDWSHQGRPTIGYAP